MDVSSHKSILIANIGGAYLSKTWHHLAVVFIVVLLVYGVTATHSVGLEDDGLFILSRHFAGVAHPPGYPLFTLFGHLFDQIPFGSTAYKVHFPCYAHHFLLSHRSSSSLCYHDRPGRDQQEDLLKGFHL